MSCQYQAVECVRRYEPPAEEVLPGAAQLSEASIEDRARQRPSSSLPEPAPGVLAGLASEKHATAAFDEQVPHGGWDTYCRWRS